MRHRFVSRASSWVFTFLFGLLFASAARAAEKPSARGFNVEAVNESPTFHVRVSVDHPDRTYAAGDVMKVTVHSGAEGYLYLFYLTAEGKTWLLFPNSYQKENKIPAGQPIQVPAEGAKFRLAGPPFGKEILKAVVTKTPLPVKGLDLDRLTKSDATEIELDTFKAAYDAVKAAPADWAEHSIEITTLAKPMPVMPKVERRVGVFVGIGLYKDPKTNPIPFCKADAETAAAVFKDRCGLDEAIVLTNAEATRATLEDVIRKKLPALTKPGDTVILFWSGHGARIPMTDGSGGHEYLLILHDTQSPDLPAKPTFDDFKRAIAEVKKSTLPSAVLQRWLQELDGRKILIVADACHASGLHAQGKSLFADDSAADEEPFLADLLRRGKSLDQRGLALIAGCKASQSSWPRKEGDYSVLTYFLLQALKDGDGPMTLPQLFGRMTGPIAEYMLSVKKDQTPVLIDQMSPPMQVRVPRRK